MDKKQKNKAKQNQNMDSFPLNQFNTVQSIINQGPSKDDPNGSYTGKPLNRFEEPVQDSDDL